MSERLTERQNADRVFGRAEGDPQWVPIAGQYNEMVFSSGLHERPSEPYGQDWSGCWWRFDEKCLGYAPDLTKPPVLEDITRWREVVPFPDLEAIDWEECARRDLAAFDRENKYLCMFMETGPWERVQALMGMTEAFASFYEEPEALKELLNAITDYKVTAIRKIGEYYHPDEYFAQDDLGTAKGPMFSNEIYREFLQPCHKRIADAIHETGALYMHHSCGCMDALMEDLYAIGVDTFNPLQGMNDWEGIASKFGDRACFSIGVGSVDRADNTPDFVRNEIHRIIDTFGPSKHLSVMCFPTNADALPLIDVAITELQNYGHEFYAN